MPEHLKGKQKKAKKMTDKQLLDEAMKASMLPEYNPPGPVEKGQTISPIPNAEATTRSKVF